MCQQGSASAVSNSHGITKSQSATTARRSKSEKQLPPKGGFCFGEENKKFQFLTAEKFS
jgi:hypothetical protein